MIDFKGVCKSYSGQDILIDANFRINQNDQVGVIGPNGAGKSTIFRIITREEEPDKGQVDLPKGKRIGYLAQHLKVESNDESLIAFATDSIKELGEINHKLEVLEQELERNKGDERIVQQMGQLQHDYEALGGYRIKSEAEAALSGLGFTDEDFMRPLKSFSGGWQMRAAMARVLVSEPDILLLDEPSNYLDLPAIEWLNRYLKKFKGTLLLISHDRYLLKALTNITLEINAGIATRYPGNYDFYERERGQKMLQLTAAKRNQDVKRKQMERFIERFRSKNTKASLVKSHMKKLDKMDEVNLPDSLHYSGEILLPDPPHSGHEIVSLENAGFYYEKDKYIFKDVNLTVNKGDKLAFVGYNGMGKTTLLKILTDHMVLKDGKRILGHKVVVGYQAQEFADILPMEQSVFDVVKGAARGDNAKEQNVRNCLGTFGFSNETIYKQCKVLSGGEKIRLCFARIFINPPNFLVLDEPTTHLDLAAREGLQETLKRYKGTLCLVSHDIEFVRNVADGVVAMRPMGIRKYFGSYDYYKEKVSQEEIDSIDESPTACGDDAIVSQKDLRKQRAEKRQELSKKKKELEKTVGALENAIEQAETEKDVLIQRMLDESNKNEFPEIAKRLKELDSLIESSSDDWEQAAASLEEFMIEYDAIHQK